jgi:hypothetical protein
MEAKHDEFICGKAEKLAPPHFIENHFTDMHFVGAAQKERLDSSTNGHGDRTLCRETLVREMSVGKMLFGEMTWIGKVK